MNYNKVVSVRDYPELMGTEPPLSRKAWEVQMALRTLRDFGAVHAEASIFGAGAGHEATIYHLSNEVKWVWATDLYLTPGVWGKTASTEMLSNPAHFAPSGVPFDVRRIVPQHADMCRLPYPDGAFDGIFSSGSIEHVGTFEDVLVAASELGRVLKAGGILSLATEYKVDGKGGGWPGVLLLDDGQLAEMVAATGCELVDELVTAVDAETLATAWPLDEIVRWNRRPPMEAVLKHGHYTFTSVHLALRKPLADVTADTSTEATPIRRRKK